MAENSVLSEPRAIIVTAEQIELVRRTVAQGATDDELRLYLYDCARQGVHPLDKLIHFTKRSGKYTPITSIDLMRIRAHDTSECGGIDDPVFEGALKLAGFLARVTVYRLVQGDARPFTATARWTEYCPAEGQDHMWQKMPHTMLGKCAEALALRKAFPKQLGGLYAREEMDQAGLDGLPPSTTPGAPPSPPTHKPGDPVFVVDVAEKKGKSPWRVTLSDGRSGGTFKDDLAEQVETLKISQTAVQAEFQETTSKGKTYTNLVSIHPAAEPAPEGPQPGVYHIKRVQKLFQRGAETVYGVETQELGTGQFIQTADVALANTALKAKMQRLPVELTFSTAAVKNGELQETQRTLVALALLRPAPEVSEFLESDARD